MEIQIHAKTIIDTLQMHTVQIIKTCYNVYWRRFHSFVLSDSVYDLSTPPVPPQMQEILNTNTNQSTTQDT